MILSEKCVILSEHRVRRRIKSSAGSFGGGGFWADRRRNDAARGRLATLEFERIDPPAAFRDLLGRGQDLRNVVVRLPEVLLQVENPLVQAAEIVHQMADFG